MQNHSTNWHINLYFIFLGDFVDLISASLLGTERKCDDNNNRKTESTETSTSDENNDGSVEMVEKIKPKQMVGLFPLDLRSELKQRIGGGLAGFSLKKSITNVDVFNNNDRKVTEPISIRASQVISKPDDLLKSIGRRDLSRKINDDSDDDGMENLSFKEKLQLIERSSSKQLVNPL
jgi:hypothetical protein